MSIVMFGFSFFSLGRVCVLLCNILGILEAQLDLVAAAKLRSATAGLGLGWF
jgi:hypothetical protein